MASGKLARFIAIFIKSFKMKVLQISFDDLTFLGFLSKGETLFLFINTQLFGNPICCMGDKNYGKHQSRQS